MRNIWRIIKGDTRRICSSVVAIIVIMGLCIVPCLYAWFNIFSNWDPYGTDATSRIRVAVVSEDRGANILGLELNVGEEMIKALEANAQVGWVFADTKDEALSRVYSSDCYAALVVPPNFTQDIVSFLSLKFEHPQLSYYENGKKNAIAPKITAQAKTAVQQQVNATFLQTLASSAAKVISVLEAGGMDAEATLQNLSDTVEELGENLDGCNATLNSLVNLTSASQSLMYASGTLVGDLSYSFGLTAELAGNVSGDLPAVGSNIREMITKVVSDLQGTGSSLNLIYSELASLLGDRGAFEQFAKNDLQSKVESARNMQQSASNLADACESMGLNALAIFARDAADNIGAFADELERLGQAEPGSDEQWLQVQEQLLAALERLNAAREAINSAVKVAGESLGTAIEDTFIDTGVSMENARQLLAAMQGGTASVAGGLKDVGDTLGTLDSGLLTTMNAINKARMEIQELSDFLEALSHSKFLQQIITFFGQDTEKLNGHIASPIQVTDEIMYPADGSYGSQMSPFYTMLAQWVGALFCAVLLKTPLRREDMSGRLRMSEHYFGRLCLFLLVGITQALITSLGDLIYVDIFCVHPWRFVFAAVVSGICFTMINYMLVFTLGAAGLAVSVIVMVVQVAGAGGTYPVDVVPEIFRKVYPFMPFKFGMNAMREAVSGMYGTVYRDNMLILTVIGLGTVPIAFLIYKPAKWLNDLLEKAKKATGVMT